MTSYSIKQFPTIKKIVKKKWTSVFFKYNSQELNLVQMLTF